MPRAQATTRRAAISGDILIAKISGETVQVQSGLYLASGIYVVTPGGAGGGQVSGAVIISGDIRSVLSGMVRALISGDYVIQSISTLSGQYLASGIYVVAPAQVSGAVIISGDIRSVLSGMVRALISGDTVVQASGSFVSSLVSGTVSTSVSGNIVDLRSPTALTSGGIFVVGAQSGGVILTSGPCVSVVIKSFSRNSGNIYVGPNQMQSGQGYVLEPGESVNYDVANYGLVHLLADISGDTVTYTGVL